MVPDIDESKQPGQFGGVWVKLHFAKLQIKGVWWSGCLGLGVRVLGRSMDTGRILVWAEVVGSVGACLEQSVGVVSG